MAKDVVHLAPENGYGRMSCCNRTPFEVPASDQMTLNESLVTCGKAKGERK